jgi:hypothetical protein
MDVADLSYLWDGSQPGWRLCPTHRCERRILLHFEPSGPTVREVVAMRVVFDEFRSLSAHDVWAVTRGKSVIELATVFGPIDEPQVSREAHRRGLRVEVVGTGTVSYRAHNTATGASFAIEFETVGAEVARRMIAAGCPVDVAVVD